MAIHGQATGNGLSVHFGVAGTIELDRLTCDLEIRGLRVVIVDDLTKVGERSAEVGACGTFRPIRPQERGQMFASMGTIRLDREISK
jgi:hypothetical protein